MTELDEILALLVEHVDGALAAAVAGMDGLLVEQYPAGAIELAPAAAELTTLLSLARDGVTERLTAGALKELVLAFETRTAYVRFLDSELYCLILLEEQGNLGKARLYAEQAAVRLGQVFA